MIAKRVIHVPSYRRRASWGGMVCWVVWRDKDRVIGMKQSTSLEAAERLPHIILWNWIAV